MKQQIKIKYFSPEQAKYINPDLIDYVTLNNGSTIKLDNAQNCSQSICQNPGVCKRCGKVKYMGQTNNFSGSPYVFRGGKKGATQAEVSGAGIEVSPEGVKTENLQGAEGALLTDILTGGGYNFGDDQNGNQGQVPQEQGQEQGYYEGDQQGTVPQQYIPVPEQYQDPDGGYTNEYADPNQYYPGEQNPTTNLDEAIHYGPSENPQEQPEGVQEEYVNPDIPKDNYPQQDYPQQPEEQIPVQAPYIPVNPVAEQPVQPVQPYQQPSQPQPYPYQQPSQPPQQSQPYQQPMQPIIPPQVIPASNAAKTNAPVQQGNNNNTAAPKSFKELFKEAKKQAKDKLKKNNVFRARRKEVQSNICPKCHLPKEILCPDCQRKDDESRLNSQRNTQKEDQKEDQKDNENPQKDNNNNNEKNDNLTPRRNNYQNEKRNPQRDDNKNNRRNNQENDNNRRNPQRNDNNRRNNQGNDNNRRNPQRDDNKNNRRNNQGNDNNRRNNQGNDNNRRNNQGNDKDNNRRNDFGNSRRRSQDDNKKKDLRNLPWGRRSDNINHLRGNSDNIYNSRTFEKRNNEYDIDFDNYRYYATNNTTMENRRTITIVKRGDIIIAKDE
jgi:hypothetical protein